VEAVIRPIYRQLLNVMKAVLSYLKTKHKISICIIRKNGYWFLKSAKEIERKG
jgi:hypothetical protein